MITRVDERLRREARELDFCFTCERCAHFDAESGSCGNGYPNAAHRGVELDEALELCFCKEFELA